MNQTQLKIRIRLDQSVDHPEIEQNLPELPKESAPSPSPTVYEYNWPRITAAGLVLLFVLITLIWITSDWASDNEEFETNPAEMTLPVSFLSSSPESLSTEPVRPLTSTELLSNQFSEENAITRNMSGIESGHTEKTPDPQPRQTSPTVSKSPITPGVKPRIATSRIEKKNTLKRGNHFYGLAKAQLTSNIRQRQPVDSIDHISLEGKSSRPIFLFLHLNKLKGEKIFINWYYQDQSVAKVSLLIGNDDWRTYSSKMLNQNRLGLWRVTTTDQAGNLLAEFKFRVTR